MILLLIGILIFLISGYYPHITEKLYSTFIYKFLAQIISSVTGLLPFSLAEWIIAFFALFTILFLFKSLFYLIKYPDKTQILKRFFLKLLTAAGIIYFSFQMLWGLNYNRLSLYQTLDLPVERPNQEELAALCEDLIARANSLRAGLKEDGSGVMTLPYEKKEALEIAYLGFEKASSNYPHLDGKYGRPKGLMSSKLMCYTGITGFIFPFTGEANVNMAIPEASLPFTVAHEMAHQRGFAREDEANFIAYVACIYHPDVYFQYSGILSALNYSMGALRRSDWTKYEELLSGFSPGLINDLNFNNYFWNRYSGPIERASNKINDSYLKSHNQRAGVKSYGAMVDLLIAEYKKTGRIKTWKNRGKNPSTIDLDFSPVGFYAITCYKPT